MAQVILSGVSKTYGERKTVHDIDLTVEDREFMVLVGPSGCGKSTTLRMVAGLEDITSGTLMINGRDVTETAPQKRDIAMVFQSYALYPHMTAWRNMAFGLQKTTSLSRAEIDARIREAAEILNITDLLDRRPKELSGGERQRVAIGRALVRKPSVFLFDEPLSNLDAKLRHHMRAELKRLHSELGLTVIYVTHDQIEAMTLGTRVAVLSKGQLQQVGAPMEVYLRPANRFVATFIGAPEMALLPVRASQGQLTHPGFVRALPFPVAGSGGFLLGLRPEEMQIRRDQGMARARVKACELIGAEALVELQMGADLVTVKSPVPEAPAAGEEVWLDLDLLRARLFDAQSGQAITAAHG